MIPATNFFELSDDELTPKIEEEFFSSLKLRNGTYKTTFHKRFSEINEKIIKLLKTGDIKVDNLLDIGISSGISTLELSDDLHSAGYTSYIVGTDFMMDAYIVRVLPYCFALVDNTCYPLRYDLFKWSMKPWVIKKDYRSGFFILRKCINLLFQYRAKNTISRSKQTNIHNVKLITPKLFGHENIIVQKDDVTKFNHLFAEKFDFIRAANILNKGYFTSSELITIINNIKQYLTKPKGTLLIVRTHENGDNHGSLFSIENHDRCNVIKRFGTGSEIEGIVLESMCKT